MKKIIIFSTYSKLYSVDQGFAKRKDIKDLDTSLILFSKNGAVFSSVLDFSAYGLYLVYDGMQENTFYNLIGTSDKTNFYILLHSNPMYIKGFKNLAIGTNASKENGGKIYPDVVSILEENEENKVDRIFKLIFKTDHILEAKISLIASINAGQFPATMPPDLKEYQEALEKFQLHKDKDWLSEEYTKAFEQLLSDLEMEI